MIPRKGRYGYSTMIDKCPFCDKLAIVKNIQGISVCVAHKDQELKQVKCICGRTEMILVGKFGPYVNCTKCGNVSLKKILNFRS